MSPTDEVQGVFDTVSLQSERRRIIGVLILLGALAPLVPLRALLADDTTQRQSLPIVLAVLLAALAYECWMYWRVARALRQAGTVATGNWILNVLVEALLPTVGLLALTETEFLGPYRALIAPAILLYPAFIILSTLQLRPFLSVLSGLMAALGYAGAVVYTFLRYDVADYGSIALPGQLYATYPFMLAGIGGIAAFVSSRLRRYVRAGLEEGMRRERIERDLELARSIQKGLLPDRPPDATGYEIAGWNEPADETGGDYYDWLQLPDGRISITIADVTGHGIGPAIVTAVCRAYARAVLQGSEALAAIVERINRLLHKDLPDDRFVTLAMVLLDPESNTVEFLSAGHGPIISYSASAGEAENLNADGLPLGILDEAEYGAPRRMEMVPGDVLALITDGFFEWAREDGTQYGTSRLASFIAENAGLPASTLIERLHESVTAFAGTAPQQDDLTAVIIKRCAVNND